MLTYNTEEKKKNFHYVDDSERLGNQIRVDEDIENESRNKNKIFSTFTFN